MGLKARNWGLLQGHIEERKRPLAIWLPEESPLSQMCPGGLAGS